VRFIIETLLEQWEIEEEADKIKALIDGNFYNILAVIKPEVFFKLIEKDEKKEEGKIRWDVPASKDEFYEMLNKLQIEKEELVNGDDW